MVKLKKKFLYTRNWSNYKIYTEWQNENMSFQAKGIRKQWVVAIIISDTRDSTHWQSQAQTERVKNGISSKGIRKQEEMTKCLSDKSDLQN